MAASMAANAQQDDPYQWLEDVTGDKPMEWVKGENARSTAELEARKEFKPLHERLLAIYNSRERIPSATKRGEWLYNFWQDEKNPRGLWRRTTMDEYRKSDPKWETVLDIGALGAAENVNWVYKGAHCLYPDYKRCLVSLSRGGADAVEIREFDAERKEFVKGGFVLPESKGDASWRDADTLYIARDFGPGTLTKSGYPRIVKEWKRGTPMADAKVIFEGKEDDVSSSAQVVNEKGRRYELLSRNFTFWESDEYILDASGKWVMLDTPKDAQVSAANGWLLVQLRTPWAVGGATLKAGSLVGIDLDRFLAGARNFTTIYEPSERAALQSFAVTRNLLVLDLLDNVKSRIVEARRADDGRWALRDVAVPPSSAIGVAALDRDASDDYWMTVTSFVEPTTLYLASPGKDAREKMKGLPAFFDAKGLVTRQYEATSKDGTKVPYFVVMREDAKLDGSNPTILYGYGGYEISMLPSYSGTIGAAWLERGGVWVLSNIRGGGEFGPEWHRAAQREGRHRTH
ncbi:MAG: hypothetical protein ACXWHA_15675, partial [Usitatibacter sp.]